MKAIYIIGNGFDLAHGLRTSYNDFMLDYLRSAYSFAESNNKPYNDGLINLFSGNYILKDKADYTLNEFLGQLKSCNVQIHYHSDFMKMIIQDCQITNWVDIENLYFREIKRLAKHNIRSGYLGELISLNESLSELRNRLFDYLSRINAATEIDFESDHAKDILKILKAEIPENNVVVSHEQSLILNFNYTDTIDKYVKNIRNRNLEEIRIHGNLDDLESIIFGYGDEMDDIVAEIEKKNDNLFFAHLKSFGYFKDDNYQKVMKFLNAKNAPIKVHILGHSLGLSDRILLNHIFEHESIYQIKIHYYQSNQGKDDFVDKTYEISRHFKNKSLMRNRIIPKNNSSCIPQKL